MIGAARAASGGPAQRRPRDQHVASTRTPFNRTPLVSAASGSAVDPDGHAHSLEDAAVAESGRTPPGSPYSASQRIGLVAGAALLALLLSLSPPEGLSLAGWRTAAVGLLMAVWWITEAVPIPVTSLLPLLLFPMLGVADVAAAASPYSNPLIFLYMGGFMIALAMQRWGLHRRIALNIIRVVGTGPRSLIAGFMVAAAFLSMWVSNTATAMMMMPIGLSVVEIARASRTPEENAAGYSNFSICLMLGLAYACSIGGITTLIGTPTNALLAGFLQETYGYEIGFARWLLLGVPLLIVGLPITHFVLTRVVYPIRIQELAGGRALIERELQQLGRVTRAERHVGFVFGGVAVLWVAQPLLGGLIPGLSDTGIAMAGALALFLIPVSLRTGTFLLDWRTAETLPWGVLILFGGGLSLAAAVARTGLAEWISRVFTGIADWPTILIILAVSAVVILLTELTSNTATAAAFLPVMVALALGIGQNPLLFAIPTVIAASCAFMLPVATPPNAIVFGSSFINIRHMVRAGLVLNVVFLLLVTGLTYVLLPLVFGVQIDVVPDWAIR
jgi:solute carrier family 13 (sodium-dependent dicarboxylate transporter), member 2/3/5